MVKKSRKKKEWVPLYAPETLKRAFLGDTLIKEDKEIEGKNITLNMATAVGDMKKQHLELTFKVVSFVDNKGHTEITGTSLTSSYVKRMVRKGKTKVEDSFLAKTSDNKTLRVKPIIITHSKTTNSIASKMRVKARELLTELVSKKQASEVFDLVVNNKVQKDLKDKLSKVYPVRYADAGKIILLDQPTANPPQSEPKMAEQEA